jgi:hypothetical protein
MAPLIAAAQWDEDIDPEDAPGDDRASEEAARGEPGADRVHPGAVPGDARERAKEEPEDEGDEGEDKDGSEEDAPEKPKGEMPGDMIDGVPESFVGPALAELVAHEVGHTLGLRHNFKGSAVYELSEINSQDFKDDNTPWSRLGDGLQRREHPHAGQRRAVRRGAGRLQLDRTSGEYDLWAIEFGYTFGDPEKVLSRRCRARRCSTRPTRTRGAPTRWPAATTCRRTRSTGRRTRWS